MATGGAMPPTNTNSTNSAINADIIPVHLIMRGNFMRWNVALLTVLLPFFIAGCSSGISNQKIEQDKKLNATMAEKNKKMQEDQERAEREEIAKQEREKARIASIPRQRCYLQAPGGDQVVKKLLDIINRENVTCRLDRVPVKVTPLQPSGFRDDQYGIRVNRRESFYFGEGGIPGLINNQVMDCQPDGMEPNAKGMAYNNCVAYLTKGLRMWAAMTRDKSISDETFRSYLFYANRVDFGEWALFLWQYKRAQ
ncbi:hypothetical protein [Pectobacterium aroidearum]|uniref:hypothetical protein n=1 Tax=Pectobacterium aroidearum TaxID=1201031 RepID=UPI002113FE10|nr:hypothetical protein [Pectobacterium aroidearum]UUE44941.1 hypothetical protein L0Y28_21020 [Pectobacterium aroidearum]UUE61775.1 hypothetical protein L0Y29_21020 [Pectobacterium aroidearum]UUE65999.1 hypothetical protein L0Y22_21015 [Pectobacterium aroidearum]